MASWAENKKLLSDYPQAKSFYFVLIFLFNTKSKDLTTLQIDNDLWLNTNRPICYI